MNGVIVEKASTRVTVQNKLGIHARPSMMILDVANQFESDIQIACEQDGEQKTADAKSVMEIITLAATEGTGLTITASGPDARHACDALTLRIQTLADED